MGLDISAFKKVELIDCVYDEDDEPIDPNTREPIDYHITAYVNSDYPERAEGVKHKGAYNAADSLSFRAGSYSGYNAWRNELAKMAGYPEIPVDRYNTGNVQMRSDYSAWKAESGPFWEMISFSDCEGVIGTAVSAKLAKDFAEFDQKAKDHDATLAHRDWFYHLYQEWRLAFEMAADAGFVVFH